MLITRPVGDIFVYSVPDAPMDVWLKVLKAEEEDLCKVCVFENRGLLLCSADDREILGHCAAVLRTDDNNVIFSQLGVYNRRKEIGYGD